MKRTSSDKQGSSIRDRLIVALDMDAPEQALELVSALKGSLNTFKVGSQLFTNAGPDIVRKIHGLGCRVFLDLKYHDIPSTVGPGRDGGGRKERRVQGVKGPNERP